MTVGLSGPPQSETTKNYLAYGQFNIRAQYKFNKTAHISSNTLVCTECSDSM